LDELIGQTGNDFINGGATFDVGVGGPGNDVLEGSGGDDVLVGEGGEDRILGGDSGGLEILAPGTGDDLVNGGGGTLDLVTYADAGQGVMVNLSITTPQPTGQGLDRLVEAEGLEGTDFDDQLTGNGLQTLAGNGLFGLGGDDILFGGEGDDFLDGGAETSQDTGDGGSEVVGDFCTEIELPVDCEQGDMAALRVPRSSWAGASAETRDTWSRFLL
jgi:Ca2+-binding RTX toxin-like protein